MSSYTQKIASHPVHSNMNEVICTLDSVKFLDTQSSAGAEIIARITLIAMNFQGSLTTCLDDLISLSWLDEASDAFSHIAGCLDKYKINRDASALEKESSEQLDMLLLCTTKMNCIKSNENLSNLQSATDRYIRAMDVYTEKLSNRVQDLGKRMDDLMDAFARNETISTSRLKELKVEIDREKRRISDLIMSYEQQIEGFKQSIGAMGDSFRKDFLDSQQERKRLFEHETSGVVAEQKKIAQWADEQQEEMDRRVEELIEKYKESFATYENDVKQLVGTASSTVFSHRYKEVADDAHKRAAFWHRIAFVLIIAIGAFAVYAFISTVNYDTSWIRLVAKIFATATLVIGAAYAARQASKQEKVERYARRIEMELVTIDPFLLSLDEERRSKIKEELSRKIFGNSNAMEISSKEEPYIPMDKLTSIEEMIGLIAEKIS